jgi:hypothetical protein
MSKKLTIDYIKAHMGENEKVYREAGKLLTDAILNEAISFVKKNGETEKIILKPTIEVQAFEAEGCVTVTYTDGNGNTISYHRAT